MLDRQNNWTFFYKIVVKLDFLRNIPMHYKYASNYCWDVLKSPCSCSCIFPLVRASHITVTFESRMNDGTVLIWRAKNIWRIYFLWVCKPVSAPWPMCAVSAAAGAEAWHAGLGWSWHLRAAPVQYIRSVGQWVGQGCQIIRFFPHP